MRLIEWLYQINLMWMLATWCGWSSRHDQHDEINKMKTGIPKDFTVEIKQHHLMMWFPKLNSRAPDSGRRCHAVLAIRSNTSPTLTTASVCLPPRLSSALRYSAELQCYSATVLRLLRDLRDGPFSKTLSTWHVKPSRLQFCLEITWITGITGLSTEPKFSESWSRSGSRTFSWHCQPKIFQHLSGVDCSKTAEIFSKQTPGHSSAFHQIYFTQHPPILPHTFCLDLILNFGNFLKFPLNHSNHCLTLSKPHHFWGIFHGFPWVFQHLPWCLLGFPPRSSPFHRGDHRGGRLRHEELHLRRQVRERRHEDLHEAAAELLHLMGWENPMGNPMVFTMIKNKNHGKKHGKNPKPMVQKKNYGFFNHHLESTKKLKDGNGIFLMMNFAGKSHGTFWVSIFRVPLVWPMFDQ